MQKTNISWCTHTWNPTIGCPLPLVSSGCNGCYARKLHNRRHKAYKAGKKLPKQYAKPFEEMQLFPERLEEPLSRKKPARIFVGSMTELFNPAVPFEFIDKVYGTMILSKTQTSREINGRFHKFQLLTKRPEVMLKYCESQPWPRISNYLKERYGWNWGAGKKWHPENVHLGVSISNQAEADEKIPILKYIPTAVRWLSIEPLIEEINFVLDPLYCVREPNEDSPVACVACNCGQHWEAGVLRGTTLNCLDWVVIGCESSPKRRPCKIGWVRNIVKQCKAAGVSVFVKQLSINGKVSHDPEEWPEDLRVQDYPL